LIEVRANISQKLQSRSSKLRRNKISYDERLLCTKQTKKNTDKIFKNIQNKKIFITIKKKQVIGTTSYIVFSRPRAGAFRG
jgi:hypothetical protein